MNNQVSIFAAEACNKMKKGSLLINNLRNLREKA
jgi:hypothetical protein